MTSLIEMKGREHSELQEKKYKGMFGKWHKIKNEILGLKVTTKIVSQDCSVLNVKGQEAEQQEGLW